MNKLPDEKRVQILNLLVEGNSVRGTSRITGTSTQTVMKLLNDVGGACRWHHRRTMKNVHATHVQADEIRCFVYSKPENVSQVAPEDAGIMWTWTAIENTSKLVISYMNSQGHGLPEATRFMRDLKSRVVGRIHLTTDKLACYPAAVEAAFGEDVDYAQVGKKEKGSSASKMTVIIGKPDPGVANNSFVERQNRTMRMLMRRFARRTEAHSRTARNHRHHVALYFTYYNFCRAHSSLGTFITPAMAAGVDDEQHDLQWILDLVEERERRRRMVAFREAVKRQRAGQARRMRTGEATA